MEQLKLQINTTSLIGFIKSKKFKMYSFIIIAILPVFILYTVIILYPLMDGLVTSFFKWSGLTLEKQFIGLNNYKDILDDKILIFKAFKNDMILAVARIFIVTIISFFFAEVLCRMSLKEKGLYKIVFFFPNVLSGVVIATLWMFIYNPQFGLLNGFLDSIGLHNLSHPWLADTKTALASLIPPMVWGQVGFYMIIYIAAINTIPKTYYEAATIDGAGYMTQLSKITIPLVWGHVRTGILLMVVGFFGSNFSYVYVMTGGGPGTSTRVMMYYLYDAAFNEHNYGYAAVIGVIMTFVALFYTLIINRLLKKEDIQY